MTELTDKAHRALTRARVVLTSAVTIITGVAALIATVVVPELTDLYGADHRAVVIAGQVATAATALVAIIRRVTPVPLEQRGLLPTAQADEAVIYVDVPTEQRAAAVAAAMNAAQDAVRPYVRLRDPDGHPVPRE